MNVQRVQNQECLYMADTVPAGGQQLARVAVSNLGAFFLQHISLSYTTLATVAAVITDTGIDYLRGRLIDGTNNKPLFSDFIPFGLWGTPGRRQSLPAGPASFQMHIIFPFEYLFGINSDIQLDVHNDSNLPNLYSVAFWGVRIRSAATSAGM
jgi:hypothetical protein